MRRRTFLAGGGVLAATALSGCLGGLLGSRVTEPFSDSYDVPSGAALEVVNRNGPVTVRPAEGARMAVSGEKRANSQAGLDSIEIDVTGDDPVRVEAEFGSGSAFSNRGVDLTVEVPEGVPVDRARTTNGDVTVSDVRGDAAATTTNGDVEVTDVSGYVRCETTNGDVRARGTRGVAGARTTNGSVDVELLGMDDDVTCRSSNGSVTARVGPDVAAGFRLETSNGDAEVLELDHTVTASGPNSIEGRIRGADSPVLALETNNGDVTLRPA
jgi:hypothetical protein